MANIDIEDWDDLLNAVKERLRLTVGQCQATTSAPPAQGKTAWVQASVLECVAALDQLQLAFRDERRKHRQLELELCETHTALATRCPDQGQRG